MHTADWMERAYRGTCAAPTVTRPLGMCTLQVPPVYRRQRHPVTALAQWGNLPSGPGGLQRQPLCDPAGILHTNCTQTARKVVLLQSQTASPAAPCAHTARLVVSRQNCNKHLGVGGLCLNRQCEIKQTKQWWDFSMHWKLYLSLTLDRRVQVLQVPQRPLPRHLEAARLALPWPVPGIIIAMSGLPEL